MNRGRCSGVVLALLLTPACAGKIPLTRTELVAGARQGEWSMHVEPIDVPLSFQRVLARFEEKVGECLDTTVDRTGMVGGQVEVASTTYTPKLTKTAEGRAEFSLQILHRPRGLGPDPPPGGYFLMAADIEALGAEQTRVVTYEPTMGHSEIVAAVREWAKGEDAPCPEL